MAPTEKIIWRKPSRSAGNGGNCVELAWRKSSRSGGNNGNCVELAYAGLVRDSKNPGPTMATDIGVLIGAVKADRFER
jgi:hypothetical protein